jgi:hypothetical protein
MAKWRHGSRQTVARFPIKGFLRGYSAPSNDFPIVIFRDNSYDWNVMNALSACSVWLRPVVISLCCLQSSFLNAGGPDELQMIHAGEWNGVPWKISFTPEVGAKVVFSPITLAYEEDYSRFPEDNPHHRKKITYVHQCRRGIVTHVVWIDPRDPAPGYSVRFEYDYSYKEIHHNEYSFSHLDWTAEQIRTFLSSRWETDEEGTVTVNLTPIPRREGKITGSDVDPEQESYYRGRDYGKVIKVPALELDPIQVDNSGDTDDGNYAFGEQTLREALSRAYLRTGDVNIPILISDTIALDNPVTIPNTKGTVFLFPVAGPITLDGQGKGRILNVAEGAWAEIAGIDFRNGHSGALNGGAIFNKGYTLNLVGCDFINNTSSSGYGGAIYNEGYLDIDTCNFLSNRAVNGMHLSNAGTAVVRNSTFFSGKSLGGEEGAGVHVGGLGSLSASNSAFADVIGAGSIAVLFYNAIDCEGTARLYHCTIFGGPGTFTIKNSPKFPDSASVTLDHCLVSFIRFLSGVIAYNNYNIFGQNNLSSPFAIEEDSKFWIADPFIVPVYNPTSGEVTALTLAPQSPAVDAGNPHFFPYETSPPITTDLNGNPRVANGRIDIGAIELDSATLTTLRWLLEDPAEDKNSNEIADTIEALAGHDPTKERSMETFFTWANNLVAAPAGANLLTYSPMTKETLNRAKDESSGQVHALAFQIDERATYLEGTLQGSNDSITWTDLASYQPEGTGNGIKRIDHGIGSLLSSEKKGYVEIFKEAIPTNEYPRFIRMIGKVRTSEDAPRIFSTTAAVATLGDDFTYPIEANGATHFEASGLPQGLTLDPATGVISGRPDKSGEFQVLLAAYNQSGVSELFTLFLTISQADD